MELSSLARSSLPPVLGAVDAAIVRNFLAPPKVWRHPIERLDHRQRMQVMRAMQAFYGAVQRDPAFFTRRQGIDPEMKVVRRCGRAGVVLDLTWDSNFSPIWSELASQGRLSRLAAESDDPQGLQQAIQACLDIDARLQLDVDPMSHASNRVAHARWYRHQDGPRPVAVVLHGYMGGHFALEERIWPIRTLFEGGMDVILTVLPLHGPRTPAGKRLQLPLFPAVDPREAIEGFRQLVDEHLSLFDYLLDGRATSVGMLGMSLGGYCAALLSTLDPRLAFGVLHMPLMSVADFALRSGRMVGTQAEQRCQANALELIYRAVSPLARPSLLPRERVVVSTATADRITGPAHAAALARHFGVDVTPFVGSHIAPLGARQAFAPMWTMLSAAGLWAPSCSAGRAG